MNTLPTPTHNAPDALCPICGQHGKGIAVPKSEQITQAHYICADGHVWASHWLEVN